jgi:hypothetical protein
MSSWKLRGLWIQCGGLNWMDIGEEKLYFGVIKASRWGVECKKNKKKFIEWIFKIIWENLI